mmetsp:Transcript_496/g.1598  ORF Transcript_496/g.1598 Transcript_496/m.1598 type:complete len:217 (+) Transcript_496:770-1420(+)
MKSNAEYPTLIPVTRTKRSHPPSFAANANFLTPQKFTDFGCRSSTFSAFVIQSNGFEILCAPKHATTSSYPFTLSNNCSAVKFVTSHSPNVNRPSSSFSSFIVSFCAMHLFTFLVNTCTLSYRLSGSFKTVRVIRDPIRPHPPTMQTDFFLLLFRVVLSSSETSSSSDSVFPSSSSHRDAMCASSPKPPQERRLLLVVDDRKYKNLQQSLLLRCSS